MRDVPAADAEHVTWTSREVCEHLALDRRALLALVAHIEEVFGFKVVKMGTPNQQMMFFKLAEVKLLERIFRVSERLGKARAKYVLATLVVFGEMEDDGSLEHFETTERKLHRLRSQVSVLEEVLLRGPSIIE